MNSITSWLYPQNSYNLMQNNPGDIAKVNHPWNKHCRKSTCLLLVCTRVTWYISWWSAQTLSLFFFRRPFFFLPICFDSLESTSRNLRKYTQIWEMLWIGSSSGGQGASGPAVNALNRIAQWSSIILANSEIFCLLNVILQTGEKH